MEIVFLGTGGGRVNLIKQIRATGGFRINSDVVNIHVDPGPGGLLKTLEFGETPFDLDVVVVTHNHIDHSNDAAVLIEGMTRYGFKKRGVLIGSGYSVDGNVKGDRAISLYHQGLVGRILSVKKEVVGTRERIETGRGEFFIEFKKAKHDEPTTFGFVVDVEGKKIGYTSDTEYFEGLGRQYAGCDVLIVNCLKPTSDGIPDHLKTADVVRILEEIDGISKMPDKVLLTHLGMKMIRAGPEKEAEKIEDKTGVKTIAAFDGMRVSV